MTKKTTPPKKQTSVQEQESSPHTTLEQKLVKLDDIVTGYNYRSEYDEESMQELTDSVRTHGVLQPILLRPTLQEGYLYELVSGRRRYMAAINVKALFSSRDEIPAIIRSMSDDEALELQITENLQRQDVHPLDEAEGFKRIMEQRGWSVQEIAARVGKSPKYVAQRLKLSTLYVGFKKSFYKGQISLVDLTRLFKLSVDDQQKLYEKEEYEDQKGKIEVSEWDVSKYLGKLSNAPFDITDVSINDAMGACTNCPHNSASNTLLFPDSDVNAQCGLSSCFAQKTEVEFKKRLEEAIADPEIELITTEYNLGRAALELLKNGHSVYSTYNVHRLAVPEAPDMDDYESDLEYGDYESREEMMQDYRKDVDSYKAVIQEYRENIASGKYIKGLIVEGNNKGTYIYFSLKKDSKPKVGSVKITEKEKSGTVSINDLRAEIARIEMNAKRKSELTEEALGPKLFRLFYNNDDDDDNLINQIGNNTERLSNQEMLAVIFNIGFNIQYEVDEEEWKRIGLQELNTYDSIEQLNFLLENTSKIELVFNYVVRRHTLIKMRPSPKGWNSKKNANHAAMPLLLESYRPEEVKEVRSDADQKLAEYQKKAQKKIDELKEKLAEMEEAVAALKPKRSNKKK
jgi:ParB family transcriptional regulator, chromosome partitioning protein